MERVRKTLRRLWRDADRRRAVMLSLVAHLCVLLLFVLWLSRPRPVPLEQFIVLNVGTPEQSEDVVRAATVDDPAPTSPTPQVADDDTGEPQARTAEQPENTAPEEQPRTEQPRPQQRTQPEPPEVSEQDAQQADVQEGRSEPEPRETRQDPPIAPAPQPRQPSVAESAPELPVATEATVLPEIDEVRIDPRPAPQAIQIPQPQAAARVPESVNVAVTPTAQVAAPREIPAPQTEAEVAEPQPIPEPTVRAQVAEAEPVPEPEVRAEVAEPQPIPEPTARAEVAEPRPVPEPEARAQVAEAVPVEPLVDTLVEGAAPVPRPDVAAAVAAARPVPEPATAAEVAEAREVPRPGVDAEVADAQPVTATAQAVVSRPFEVPAPLIEARVTAPEPEAGAALAGAAPAGASRNPSNRLDDRIPGGNADRTGQDRPDDDAQAGNLGRAADLEGDATGAQSPRPTIPYREERDRPLAVLLDNAAGYPQAGLSEASLIAEMPVEGGLTRLMTMYDRRDPEQVGPIRSARDYFVELARGYDGVLVHDGGSPAALAAIDRGTLPTLNAFRFGDLFSRQQERRAPYNLYSSGGSLRQAVNSLRLDRSFEVQGVVPRPPEGASAAESVEVRYGGDYRSGFSYIRELDIYRWRRNGENAVDYRGDAVFVEAVLVARIDVRPIPDDPAGRLYIPLRGGEATLYLRGTAIEGSWQPSLGGGQGITFSTAEGEPIDLAPFRIWMLFAPGYAQVSGG